jgi:hypothetical protein
VKSKTGEPTPQRGGRSKRFFHVTGAGIAAVNQTHRSLQRMVRGLDKIGRFA